MNTYSVMIDMNWAVTKVVKAKSKAEARRKAWEKFKKSPPKREFTIDAEKE